MAATSAASSRQSVSERKEEAGMPTRRHQSLMAMRSSISKSLQQWLPKTRQAKAKHSLSHWHGFETVSFPAEQTKDQLHTEQAMSISWCGGACNSLSTWLLPGLIGFLTASSGVLIEKASDRLNGLLFGHCLTGFLEPRDDCSSTWVSWSGSGAPEDQSWLAYLRGWATYALIAATLGAISASLVRLFAPTARGSGIPEVKTILGGFVMPHVLSFKTLVVKIVGLTFSVSSGMALGKEGPLVHVACCWANVCSRFSPRYTENEGKRRELISTAAAAGVAVAFGAPVGGVLFSFEEVSTMFPQRTMIRAFFAAVVAALTLVWYNPTGTGKLTMFEADVPNMPSIYELPAFMFLGVVGGLLGALFVHWNIKISVGRADGTRFRRHVPIVVEVLVIALCTGITSYPLGFTRVLSSITIRELFQSCSSGVDVAGLCDGTGPMLSQSLVLALLMSALVRFMQMTVTFGTGVPCGLFVPSLYTGACLGRCLGLFVWWTLAYMGLDNSTVHPGVYAMVGAAAMLGGVCRVTISLVVIMYELTSALQLIVPFMLAVLTAKWVGDRLTHGIYDDCISVRGYPYLHEPDDFTFGTRACDIMDEDLECLYAEAGTVGELFKKVSETTFGGFPLVRSASDRTLLGYVHAPQVKEFLGTLVSCGLHQESQAVVFKRYLQSSTESSRNGIDLSKFVDDTILRIVPETPLAQVHNIFRQLGIKIVLVTRCAGLIGMITKKSFVHHLEHGSIGHVSHDPVMSEDTAVLHAATGDVADLEKPKQRAKTFVEKKERKSVRIAAPPQEGESAENDLPVLVLGSGRRSQNRQASLTAMREKFVQALETTEQEPTSQLRVSTETSEAKAAKKSLSKWNAFQTVSVPTEDAKDTTEHISTAISSGSTMAKWSLSLLPWLIPALVGFLTASSGSLVEVSAEFLNSVRFGWCPTSPLASREACGDAWQSWLGGSVLAAALSPEQQGFAMYVLVSVVFATISATLVWAFAPTARGSGIPEVKTILGGFVMGEVLEFKTLVVKMIGLAFSVSSGMSLGKEGPLVHVACCWAMFCSKLSSRYAANEAKQRELISTAAAAGVSVAFGTPLGGVLFSYEEVSSMFPQKTMVRAFFAAVIAALSLAWYNPTGTGKLTMFETHYTDMPAIAEFPWFVLLGAVGGILGALFVHGNIWVSSKRMEGSAFRKRVPIVVEVATIALVTAITSYPLTFTRDLSTKTIRALFQSCHAVSEDFDMMGLCDGVQSAGSSELLMSLALAAALRLVQCTFTFGTGVPCGLFVPSLFTGACLGRILGVLVGNLNETWQFAATPINPGVYAMVGAAAMLGGVCRVTISLVVIMFGLTNGLQLILPFMLAILTSKFVGDLFSDGIYDACIVLRGYPYLHEPDDVSFNTRACDVMDDELECLNAEPGTVAQVLDVLKSTRFGGFPLVTSPSDSTLLGYVHTEPLRQHLESIAKTNSWIRADMPVAFRKYTSKSCKGALDISKFVDETVIRLVPETPLGHVHNIFRQLGVKLVLVSRFGHLAGLITKKAFVEHLHNCHIGHVAHDPVCVGSGADGAEEQEDRRPNGAMNGTVTTPLLVS